ncbi:MAG: response regulator [Myxococcaceae bacterium]|nr:response regulator [Myxococcaceae bacterium]
MDRGLVLVIDDDLETRAAISELLADLDYWPVTTRNGLEALESLRRGVRPAAILVDAYMPLMDGETFCAACDEDPGLRDIPRILVSANRDAAARVGRCRAVGFLEKPIDAAELVKALDALQRGRA